MTVQPFKDAVKAQEAKGLLATTLSTKELDKIASEIKELAFFSAKTENAKFVQEARNTTRAMLMATDPADPLYGANLATARAHLLKLFPDVHKPSRVDLILVTQTDMAKGYGYWNGAMADMALKIYPCFELFRGEDRIEPRDWEARWVEAAKEVGDMRALAVFEDTGRMVARKDSPIWVAISRFGLPYPPFDFNSGMDIRDVDFQEAVELGAIDENEEVSPVEHPLDETMHADLDGLDDDLKEQLLEDLGPGYGFDDEGVLRKMKEQPDADD